MTEVAKYPLPKFHFVVEWNGARFGFTEVTGLDIQTAVTENRGKKNKAKVPGLHKYPTITLKRGILESASTDILSQRKSDLIIRLLNEKGSVVSEWKLFNAFPVKIEGPGLKASGNEIAIESMELAHEGICVVNC